MQLTDKDQSTIQFVEDYKSITISMAVKLWYNNSRFGYDICRKKLQKLVRYGKLKVVRDEDTHQNIYYIKRRLPYHDLLVLDFYIELMLRGARVFYFKQEQTWETAGFESDGFVCYEINGKRKFNIIEAVRTTGVNLERYHKLYNSGEVQVLCNEINKRLGGTVINTFPKLVVIDDVRHKTDYYQDDLIKIQQLDFKLNDIESLFQ